jgi:hypothetical protein
MTKTTINRKRLLFAVFITVMVVAMLGSALARQDAIPTQPGPVSFGKPIEIVMSRGASTTTDLRSLPQTPPEKVERPEREEPDIERTAIQRGVNLPPEVSTPSVPAQNAPAPPPIMNFDGLDFANWGAGHPPDTNGDVGPTYYIQTINTSIGIFRKSDGVRVAAFTFNTFMSQGFPDIGDIRGTNNFGDPVVLYDTFEDRWVITDFAFTLSGGNVVNPPGNFQVIAVSKTGDPVSGGWNFYSINTVGGLGDYPKLGIWPDGLYMSVNMFGYPAGAAFQGPRVYAFNKQQMYAGKPTVQVVSFDGPPADFTLLPSNARLQVGTPPPGTPNYFISTWEFLNAVTVYKFHVNWNSISTSTFTGPDTPLAATSWPNAAVPNALSQGGNSLDVLQIRAMVQNQYTNLSGAESLWVAHTVRRGNTTGFAAPRWYQVNVTGGTVNPNIPQAATWDPDGANVISRFMPSVAVDRAGDMALGYSTSSSTTKPALKYAGRLSTDPINTLGQTETVLFQGTGTQTGNCGSSTCIRWGDYSAMTLDPDGCTFWYTNEYYAVDGLNHQTRIGSFSFASCTPAGAGGTISGTVTATAGGAPISGAAIQFGARSTTTNGSGFYSFTGIPAGTYPTLTASFPGYTTGTASNIGVTDGGTTTVDFSLATAPTTACLTDTTQADFLTGIQTNVDLNTSPGDVTLSNAPFIDQQNTAGTTTGTGFGTPAWTGQSFIAAIAGQLVKADVQVFCNGCGATPPNLTLSVRNTSSGLPTGADLATTTIPGSTFASGSTVTYTATFGAPVTLSSGTQYALILRPVSAPAGSGYFWIRSSPSTYANGSRVLTADSGGTWSADTTRDYNFKTYMQSGYAASGDLVSGLKDSNPSPGLTPIWSTLSWTATTPANTALKFQIAASNSDIGPFNFVGPDTTAATFFTTSGASLAQFYGLRYLQYKAYLNTTDSTQTPTLNDVTVCYTNTDCSGPASITPTPAEVCANSTGNTASGPAGAASYSWSITNGAMTGGTTSQTLTYTAGASGTVGLMLDIVEAGGCHKSGSTNVTINPIPATPTITPGGPTTFCPGGSVTLTSSSATGNQWYLNGNPIGGETNQSYMATAAGDYTVTVTTSGCTSAPSAITTVTVTDNVAPVFTGCTNLSAFTASNSCTAVVTYTPTANDNCEGARTVTCSPASGTAFAKGVTTVSCSAMDTSNNTGSCTFTVTVTDNVAPVFSGCTNVSANTASNSCDAVVTYTQPTANDNCDGARTVVCSPTAGSVFPKGVTTVSCSASDTSGNPANCMFTVTVTDNVAPVLSGCTNVSANTPSNACAAAVTYTQPTANDNCDGARTVTCNPASGSTFSKGVTTVSCSATDTSNNTGSCTFTVTVTDTTPPVITCPAPVIHGTDPGVCKAAVTYANATATDNCPGVGTPVCTPASGTMFQKGVTTVTCNVTDASSNPASCTFTVTVNDTQNPTVTCPNNINFTTPSNSDLCGTVTYSTPSGSDNCGVQSVVCSPASGFCFPVGMTTVTCTVTDTSGNTGQCTFKITVSNPCTITCPADQTASTGPGATQCGTVVNYPAPATTGGGCGTVACSPASGSFFPVGMTTVTCTTSGPSCSFKVIVSDNTPPVFPNCAGITMTAQPSCPFATSTAVSFTAPMATDNCPGTPTVACIPSAGSQFPVGTTSVTCTATDAANNTAMCTFGVSVFSFCLQDDSSPGNVVFVNAFTGDYVFCSGGVQRASGRGNLTVRGCEFDIDSTKGNRKVHIHGDTAAANGNGTGTAFIQKTSGQMVIQITDRNLTNNTCQCSSAPPQALPRDPDPEKRINGN